jgi:hypothetical protein
MGVRRADVLTTLHVLVADERMTRSGVGSGTVFKATPLVTGSR